MHSSPSSSDSEMSSDPVTRNDAPSTPKNTHTYPLHQLSELSPPNSQPASARASTASRSDVYNLLNPTSGSAEAAGSADMDVEPNGKNVNGKRTLAAAEQVVGGGGGGAAGGVAIIGQNAPGASGVPATGPAASGQGRAEDEPGYAWRNKKAQEEYARAMDQIVEKDRMIGSEYAAERGGGTGC